MTGKEILEEEFEKAGMRGYKAEQVDNFLRQVAAFVDEQETEKNDLVYKIKILADRIEEYKGDEGNIRDALLGAQKLGASIVNEAKAKAEAMTKEAKTSSDEMMAQAKAKSDSYAREALQKTNMDLADMKREGEKERIGLDRMKREIGAFKSSILKQYKAHLDMLSNLPSLPDDKSDYKAEPVAEPAPVVRVPMFDQDAVGLSPAEASAKEKAIIDIQTISSEILTNTKELELDELEQTKEFSNEEKPAKSDAEPVKINSDEAEPIEEKEEAPIDFGTFGGGKRPNYIEKFGELKFGGFGKNNENT